MRRYFPVVALVACVSACSGARTPEKAAGYAQIQGHYDKTGKLTSITYDSNRNGKIDTWSYMDGASIVRIEIDSDEDGRIDRWEYYTPDQKLEKVGWSRANNGRPDAWGYQGPDGNMAKAEFAAPALAVDPAAQPQPRAEDVPARIVRSESYEKGVVVRAEEDTNGDGKIDKWETWRDGSLSTVAFDTTGRGVPDRRLRYDSNESVSLEVDAAGTGHFKPASRRAR